MADIALKIKHEDWRYIGVVGVILGSILSLLTYLILNLPVVDGLLFGIQTGLLITLFVFLFIPWMNDQLLPKVKSIYWVPISLLFSFLSGFLGMFTAIRLAMFEQLQLPDFLVHYLLETAVLVGVLTYVIGILLYRFVNVRNQQEEVSEQYVQSRMRSLEHQLNPHFLFNALNSVAELVHTNPAKAEEAILTISTFLRTSMKEEAMILLDQEIKQVKDYIALENIRFLGAISLHISPHPLPKMLIPKFSIQFLVENAIKHGLQGANTPLTITIDIDHERQTITVSNDGKLMEQVNFGVGLQNVNERLTHLCGGKLEVTQKAPPTFVMKIGAK
jgi:sensor histidine kinase YesM